ncbi:guanine deaminase [Arthrobacter sp. V4I6]|uniref:guanine deaminase n=1 Tax=unclassified Arthrobacter TaxID=235627 RepID=UPI00278904A5|nr:MULTISPECIES: guanine deaminase [unclassified Arthrobacter]MDQ0819172.1 guanine deaminase [Arthrobacter sp. V1I7]MDQ0853355.1 guanine deaminase [Arthrobacter sp. V4I6]
MSQKAIRGTFLDFVDDPWKFVGHEHDAARFLADGLLVVVDGIIVDFGPAADLLPKYDHLEVIEIWNRLILPGFIDGHIHVPQTRILGAYGEQLLPWLQKSVFPEERRYGEREYAKQGVARFFDNLLASGTTTCQAFTNSTSVCTEEVFEEASRRNMRIITGITGIDQNAPEWFTISANDFYAEGTRLIKKYHGMGRNLYAITPRFAFGASDELLKACHRLKQENPDLWVHTHVSENPAEVRGVTALHKDCQDYLGVYEKFELVGPKFTGGHGVWLTNDEFRRISDAGAAVTFCPGSNLYLGSGLFRLGRATDPEHRVLLTFGTDMGGGNRFSLLNTLEDAYKVGMLNNTILDGSIDPMQQDLAESERNKLSPYRAFYSVTKGGAEALYIDNLVGNFDVGKEADFVALDWNGGPPATEWHMSLFVQDGGPQDIDTAAELLFGIMMVGDERAVDETWIMGERAYKKA